MTTTPARPLQRILGLGFGLALVVGTMVGVGILRPARNAVVIVALATGKNPAPIAGCDITVAKVPEVIKQPPR